MVLDRCDVLALASRLEGHSVALLEARQMGVPVVAGAVGSTAEIVDDGKTGLLVPPGDIDALTDALARLEADRELLGSMGRASLEKAAADDGPGAMAAAYAAVYREVAR